MAFQLVDRGQRLGRANFPASAHANRRVQRHQLDGVVEASVNYAAERARVKYVPTMVSQGDLRRAIGAAGFEAVIVEGNAEDAERLAREKEISHQKHLLKVGLIFTVPLFLLAMARDFGLLNSFFGGMMPGMIMEGHGVVAPWLVCSSPTTRSYWAGLVTTVT